MTVRELRKKLREYNPDAVVMIGEKTDGPQGIYDIGDILYRCKKNINDPWRADIVAILSKEAEERDDSTRND